MEETRIVLEAMKECYQWNSIDFSLRWGRTPLPERMGKSDSGEPSEGETSLPEDTLTEGEDLGEAEGSDLKPKPSRIRLKGL